MTRGPKRTLAGIGMGCLVLFGGCGAVIGSTTDATSAPAVTSMVAAAPPSAVTQTAEAPEPLLVTAPPETSTAPAPPPIIEPAPTIYVDAPAVEAPRIALSDSSGSGGGSTYYANCSEVRAAGADPIHRGEPGYSRKLDRDGDGVACE